MTLAYRVANGQSSVAIVTDGESCRALVRADSLSMGRIRATLANSSMKFCPWYPLADTEQHTPSVAGLFQVRVASGLIDYPRGKSAMLYYGWADDLAIAVRDFADNYRTRGWLCRHTEGELSDFGPRERALGLEGTYTMLLERFGQRFGTRPALLETLAKPAESNLREPLDE